MLYQTREHFKYILPVRYSFFLRFPASIWGTWSSVRPCRLRRSRSRTTRRSLRNTSGCRCRCRTNRELRKRRLKCPWPRRPDWPFRSVPLWPSLWALARSRGWPSRTSSCRRKARNVEKMNVVGVSSLTLRCSKKRSKCSKWRSKTFWNVLISSKIALVD